MLGTWRYLKLETHDKSEGNIDEIKLRLPSFTKYGDLQDYHMQ